ncbi:Ribosomal RNA small subunit methyltransferase B [uncultured Roseburia sp.]|uniref:16S rRNA (cytosine(967)-C(5))-methyltransferase n=1 Tax=Brotonthovivens ammoniilytica TaxID=2981725 RepID=A0ABT2TF07_9FIRM|nr:16S rRNA (cytosine(967)-C(5))-methyltransferase RsmB [Brotonthovivens ammoniilytica]MCU6760765.1 16S rRNA (cytosine(967)-C(5))-methyltransferase RsmB [Brotonthovivens ammoniilytica]SCI08555.1 Ribosomal RNA small subunit methyltransferase B [uncultured Roseburia sp.]
MTDRVNTRELILEILLQVTREQEYSHIAIRGVLDKYRYLPKQDRAFILRVSEGTLERLIEMDYMINQVSKTKVNKMKSVIRNILRMGVYQLKYMDAVPDRAACNEAVKLAVRKGFGGLKGFVNGVMRNISRNLSQLHFPDPDKNPLEYLSVQYSVPMWLAEKWTTDYGYENARQSFESFLAPSVTSVRTNLTLTTPEKLKAQLLAEGVTVLENPRVDYGMFLFGYDTLDSLPSFREGKFYVQDTASMLAVEQAEVSENNYVIDVCAAPGGKSAHMAEKLMGTGMVEARDLTPYKVELIEENIRRCRLANMRAVCQDALKPDPDSMEKADIVIADLPCSGLGVIGRKPDIKYRMKPETMEELAALQRQILSVVHNYVKPGGMLLYSTCTVNPQENEENAGWFEKTYPQFRLLAMEQTFPDRFTDGFFTAKFKKENI